MVRDRDEVQRTSFSLSFSHRQIPLHLKKDLTVKTRLRVFIIKKFCLIITDKEMEEVNDLKWRRWQRLSGTQTAPKGYLQHLWIPSRNKTGFTTDELRCGPVTTKNPMFFPTWTQGHRWQMTSRSRGFHRWLWTLKTWWLTKISCRLVSPLPLCGISIYHTSILHKSIGYHNQTQPLTKSVSLNVLECFTLSFIWLSFITLTHPTFLPP